MLWLIIFNYQPICRWTGNEEQEAEKTVCGSVTGLWQHGFFSTFDPRTVAWAASSNVFLSLCYVVDIYESCCFFPLFTFCRIPLNHKDPCYRGSHDLCRRVTLWAVRTTGGPGCRRPHAVVRSLDAHTQTQTKTHTNMSQADVCCIYTESNKRT